MNISPDVLPAIVSIFLIAGFVLAAMRWVSTMDNGMAANTDATRALTAAFAEFGEKFDTKFLDHEVRIVRIETREEARAVRATIRDEDQAHGSV